MYQKLFSYIIQFLFPIFDELKLIMILTISIALCIINNEFRHQAGLFFSDPKSFFIVLIAFILLISIFANEEVKQDFKEWAAVFYYGFFALIAIQALRFQTTQHPGSSFEQIFVVGFMQTMLIITIARGIIALLSVRDPHMGKLTAQTLSNTQYRFWGFILGITICFIATLIVGLFINDPAKTALFSFSLANAVIMLTIPFLRSRLIYG